MQGGMPASPYFVKITVCILAAAVNTYLLPFVLINA